MKKVCSINVVLVFALMLIIPGMVLHADDPHSTQEQAAMDAQPISTAGVPPALRHALANSLGKATLIGAKSIPTPPTGSWGIVSEGDGGGGIFRDSDSEAEVWLGTDSFGVQGFGSTAGGYFECSIGSAYSYVGYGSYGIEAFGPFAGGYFGDTNDSGEAWLGSGNVGVGGEGTYAGGYFKDSDSASLTYVAIGDRGIRALGNEMGGYFKDADASGYANLAYGDYGVQGYGNASGGYFKDLDSSGYAHVGVQDYGIRAFGNFSGGYFENIDSTGYAYIGYEDFGIQAYGSETGGYFQELSGSGIAYAGYDNYGIQASGNRAGGYFFDSDSESHAYVAYESIGIKSYGVYAGGYFNDTNSSGFADVAHYTYKIYGTGAVSFVQNHPYDLSSVIVYASPEGDEVATYTRGTARLVGGEATVALGETFKWVTNPDIGLTAHLTPRGEPVSLAVAEISTEEMIVRAPENAPDGLVFDYIVYGLRIGFEESSIVQEKVQESYIPSMTDHRQLYERRPDLKSYNSLERFKGMHQAVSPKAKLDLSRAHALRDAIIEFDPSVHKLPQHPGHEERPGGDLALEDGQRGVQRVRSARGDHDQQPVTDQSDLSAANPGYDDGNVYAPSFRPSSQDLASLVTVSEIVEPGDVLVIDRSSVGMMRRGAESHDTGVVGVVTTKADVVLETQPPVNSEARTTAEGSHRAAVALAGVVRCKVDAAYGAIWPGDLLVTSLTPGHAMRTDAPLPGTTLGKALEPLEEGSGTIRVLVMLR